MLLLAACSPDIPRHSEFQPGAAREQLTKQFGTPSRIQSFANQGQVVWGPIEDYWDQGADRQLSRDLGISVYHDP